MAFDNPYDYSDAESSSAPADADAGIVEELRKTRPWVRLVGVLGLIFCGLVLVGGCFMMIASLAGGAGGIRLLTALGGAYLVFALVCGYPCFRLLRYGNAITRYVRDQTLADLELALVEQRKFWRFVGIATTVTVGLYVLAIVLAGAFSRF